MSDITLSLDDKDDRAVHMRHAALEGQPVRLLAWESLWYHNWSRTEWRPLRGESGWEKVSGGLRRTMRSRDGAHVALELTPADDRVDVTLTVTNITDQIGDEFWGAFTLRHFWMDMCVHYREAPRFRDPGFERTRISVAGRHTPLRETDLSCSCASSLPGYLVGDSPRVERAIPPGVINYGSGLSKTVADEPWIGVESGDGGASLLVGFERIHYLWANRRDPVHNCIHANPFIGDIGPGEQAVVKGRLYFTAQPLNHTIEAFNTWLREAACCAS